MKYILNEELTLEEKSAFDEIKDKTNGDQIAGAVVDAYKEPIEQAEQELVQEDDMQSNDQQDQSEKTGTSVQQLTGNETADKLLSIIKKSNDRGYAAFLNGIKSNLKNDNFPFTRLMKNKSFLNALIDVKDDLNEAGILSNIGNQIKDSKVGRTVSDIKNDLKNSTAGKNISTFKASVNPKTFSKFATVYNSILDLDTDDANALINDKKSILYDDRLYKMRNYKDITPAIEIEASAIKANDDNKRAELRQAVAQNKVSQVSSIENTSSNSNERTLKTAFKILKQDPEAAKKFVKELNK